MEKRLPKKPRCSGPAIDKGKEGKVNDNLFESERYLTYDVLRIIFKHLNIADLSNAAMVSRLWLEAANNEKRTRIAPECMMVDKHGYNCFQCLQTDITKSLMIKPVLGVFFSGFPTSPIVVFDKEGHYESVPPNYNIISLRTYGVVYSTTEIEDCENRVVCAFLPEIPNVVIKTFFFGSNPKKSSSVSTRTYGEEIKEVLDNSCNADDDRSNCVMLFCDQDGHHIALEVLKSLSRWYPEDKVTVWGGVATAINLCKSSNGKKQTTRQHSCVGIVVTGTGVRTWSIVIEQNCQIKERVENKLRALKSRVHLKKYTVGFMFACSARGVSMYDEHDVESTIFKKVFPDVPLVGCFGDGEFGTNSIKSETVPKVPRKWHNIMSTVFMILTYG